MFGNARIRRLALALPFILSATMRVHAQPVGPTPEARADERLRTWKTELSLTPEQEQQARVIMLEREKQWDADNAKVKEAKPEDRPGIEDQKATHMQGYHDRLHAVLTRHQRVLAGHLLSVLLFFPIHHHHHHHEHPFPWHPRHHHGGHPHGHGPRR